MQTIHLNLRPDLEDAARSLGLLTSERVAELIEAEVQRQRQAAWERLQARLAPVQAAFRQDYPGLTDEEAQASIDEWIEKQDRS